MSVNKNKELVPSDKAIFTFCRNISVLLRKEQQLPLLEHLLHY